MSSSSSPSFIVKTRAQAAAFREKRDAALAAYPAQLAKYAKSAFKTYSRATKSNWAFKHAVEFGEKVNGYVTTNTVYVDLLAYESTHARVFEESISDHSRAHLFEYQMPARPSPAVAFSSQLLSGSAEDAGKAELNRFLFKEYETWFPAFEAEEAEDYSEDAPSAEARWTLQCAKKLSKRFGLKVEYLASVVGAWLLEHSSA
jgi:hypothetical protein